MTYYELCFELRTEYTILGLREIQRIVCEEIDRLESEELAEQEATP